MVSHYIINGCKVVKIPYFRDALKKAFWCSRLSSYIEAGRIGKKFFYQEHFGIRYESANQITREFRSLYCVVEVSLTDAVKNHECLKYTPRPLNFGVIKSINDRGLVAEIQNLNADFEFLKWSGRWCGYYWDSAQYRVSQNYAFTFVEHFRKQGMEARVIEKTL